MTAEAKGLLMELFKISSLLVEAEYTSEVAGKVSDELQAALSSLRRAARLIERRRKHRSPSRGHVLTDRERAIAKLLADGNSYKDIAVAFGLTVASAQSRVRAIYMKLGIHSKRQIRSLFAREGR